MKEVYSTKNLGPNTRQQWQQIISELYTSLDIQIGSSPYFYAEIERQPFSDLELTRAWADYEFARRMQKHLAKGGPHNYLFTLVTQGPVTIAQFDREAVLVTASYTLLDLAEPYVFRHTERTETFFLKVPARVLETRLRNPQSHCAVARSADAGLGRIVSDVILSLRQNLVQTESRSSDVLAPQIVDLIGILFECEANDVPLGNSVSLDAIRRRSCAYIDLHLGDSNLDSRMIAAAMGISVRYLQRAFKASNQSVTDYIRKRRLLRCRTVLESRCANLTRIAEIAYRYGFCNQSHFATSFRREFGCSPREMRKR